MQQFSFCEFLTYYHESYIGIVEHSPVREYSGIVNCVLSNRDPWFHIFGCELYQLHLLGIEIECIDNEYYIYQNNSCNTELSIGDRIQRINGHSVDSINAFSPSCTSMTLDCISKYSGFQKTFTIQSPHFQSNQNEENKYVSVGENIGYLQINSFSFNSSISFEEVLRNEHLYIDLQNCSGGPINDMVTFLGNFSPLHTQMKFVIERAGGYHAICKIPYCYQRNNIKKIEILVGEHTASSAEIFCLILSQYYDCKMYGSKTTGKLVIQNVVSVDGYAVAIPIYRVMKSTNLSADDNIQFDGDAILPNMPLVSLPAYIRRIMIH